MEIVQGQNLGRCVALLSEVPQLELANGVHRQNLCRPQVCHSVDGAAVCILCPRLNSKQQHIILRTSHGLKTPPSAWNCNSRGLRQLNLKLTYDSNHSLLVGSEDDNFAIFTHCNNLRTAAHDTSTWSVFTGETMSSWPALSN